MVAFYNAGDQELYKQFQYLPQEKYRLGLGTNTNQPNMLNFNNLSNSGIMSQALAPYIYPPINQGEGESRGGPLVTKDNSDFDYESEAYGIEDSELTDDINAINNPVINRSALAKIGLSSFLGPMSMMSTAYREQQKAEAQAIENARQNEVSRRAAENQAAGTGGYQSSWGGGGGAKGDTGGFMGGSGTSADMGSFAYGGLARLL
jgi:hypothetical protein